MGSHEIVESLMSPSIPKQCFKVGFSGLACSTGSTCFGNEFLFEWMVRILFVWGVSVRLWSPELAEYDPECGRSRGPKESRTPPRRAQYRMSSDGCHLLFARAPGVTCSGGLLERSRRNTEMEDPALSPGCCFRRRAFSTRGPSQGAG